MLHCVLHVVQRRGENGKLKTVSTVTKVLRHIRHNEPQQLELGEEPEAKAS